MKNVPVIFLADEFEWDSDIDGLFCQLEQVEPPLDMVRRIMDAVLCLPPPKCKPHWHDLEELVVTCDPLQSF